MSSTPVLTMQDDLGPLTPNKRADMSQDIRVKAAQAERNLPIPPHGTNGDEAQYKTKLGNFSKGLPHNAIGEVDLKAYATLTNALSSGKFADFEKITLGGQVPLVDPQAGLAYDLEGTDSHQLDLVPPHSVTSQEKADEAVENYWMALARDVPFSQYATNSITQAAAAELTTLPKFSRKLDGSREAVTTANLFRGFTPGDLKGPYVSQFLYQTLEFGAAELVQRFQTLLPVGGGGKDWLTNFQEWLDVQNGVGAQALAWKTAGGPPNLIDPVRRYVRTGRDISQYVHVDVLFEAYFNACLYLAHNGAPYNPGNPYITSKTQTGFGTFGTPHFKALLAEVATRALKAVWFQKWYVHRHLRPEAFGGLVQNAITNTKQEANPNSDVLNSKAVQQVFAKYGTYLLPHAFPEGCPQHPSYGQGHGTVAGACTTVAKAFFDEAWQIPNPMIPSDDGLSLQPYSGTETLLVGDELNKLSANIALGRNHAAVHWRSDYTRSLILGERVAVGILRDQLATYNERSTITNWSFTGFDGTKISLVP